jgi:ribokinase
MVITLPRLPQAGETLLGEGFVMAAGGKGANQAVAAARLGAEVLLVACLGQDVFGDAAVAGYEREGIATKYIVRTNKAPSGVALIFVDSHGQNMIAVAPGANGFLSPEDIDQAGEAILASQAVVLQLEIPLPTVARAIHIARSGQIPVILNPAPARPVPDDLLTDVSVLTPNEHEAAILTGQDVRTLDGAYAAARLLHQRGVGTVVLTLGERGALLTTHDGQELVPAFPVHAIDATAAGDAFTAALACALARGIGIREAVRFANAAGALATTRVGAQPSLPTLAEVESFLARS